MTDNDEPYREILRLQERVRELERYNALQDAYVAELRQRTDLSNQQRIAAERKVLRLWIMVQREITGAERELPSDRSRLAPMISALRRIREITEQILMYGRTLHEVNAERAAQPWDHSEMMKDVKAEGGESASVFKMVLNERPNDDLE